MSRGTILDLTIATLDLADKITVWQTTTETGSDHYGIIFSVQRTKDLVDNPIIQSKYNTKRANWELCREELARGLQNNQTFQDVNKINNQRKVD